MRTRVAVLGAGGIGGTTHLPSASRLTDLVEVVAVVEPDDERRAWAGREFGVEALYRDAATMLAEVRPDVVTIATPPHTHEELSVAAMRAGAWAYTEKPLSGSLASVDRIIAAEAETGQHCVTVSQFRYAAGARAVRRGLHGGEWGRPLVGVSLTQWWRGPEYWDVPWRGKIATEFGGATTTQAYHATDLLLWLMGEWSEVVGFAGALDREIEVEDTSVAAVRFDSGAMATLGATLLSHRERTSLTVHAERASVHLETLYLPQLDEWTVHVPDAEGGKTLLEGWAAEEPEAPPQAHQAQLEQLVLAHQEGRRPELTAAESRSMIEFLSALYKSSATGRPVRRGEIAPGDPYYDALSGKAGEPA